MSEFCKIYCAGSVKAPYDWITSVPVGINRIVYINGGEGGYIKGGVRVPLKKDCLYLFPGNAHYVHTYSSYESDEVRLDHAYVNCELIPPIMTDEVLCLDPAEDMEVAVAAAVMRTLCRGCDSSGDFVDVGAANQTYLKNTILFLVDKIIEKYDCRVTKDQRIIGALRMMQENLGKQQRISDIAKACYLSTDGFIRRFKNEVGETPYSYLKKLKIRTAQNMRSAGVRLSEIAERCGYSDPCALLHAIDKK